MNAPVKGFGGWNDRRIQDAYCMIEQVLLDRGLRNDHPVLALIEDLDEPCDPD